DGLYLSGHNADTNGVEGETYLWTKEELEETLVNKFDSFQQTYDLESAQLDGKIHLVKSQNDFNPELDKLLLKKRQTKQQPTTDNKLVSSWNAILGVAFIMSYRYAEFSEGLKLAESIYQKLNEH